MGQQEIMKDVKLYSYWRSSCSWRVRLALALKGVEYEYIAVNLLHRQQLDADYKEHQNGMGQVPTLVFTDDNGETVTMTQSLAIIEYLDQVCDGTPILPTEPLALFKCRELSQIIGTGIQPVQNLSVLKKVVALTGDSKNKMKWGKETIEAGFNALEAKLSGGTKFCCGNAVSMADLCLIPQVYNANRFKVDMHEYPKIVKIMNNLNGLSELRPAHPDEQPDAVK